VLKRGEQSLLILQGLKVSGVDLELDDKLAKLCGRDLTAAVALAL
jgi:hypothetical protein